MKCGKAVANLDTKALQIIYPFTLRKCHCRIFARSLLELLRYNKYYLKRLFTFHGSYITLFIQRIYKCVSLARDYRGYRLDILNIDHAIAKAYYSLPLASGYRLVEHCQLQHIDLFSFLLGSCGALSKFLAFCTFSALLSQLVLWPIMFFAHCPSFVVRCSLLAVGCGLSSFSSRLVWGFLIDI